MIELNDGEKLTFIGEVVKPLYYSHNNYYIEFNVCELNRKRIRPENILVCVKRQQKQYINNIDKGDILFVKGLWSTDNKYNVKSSNFAFLLDYKLLHRRSLNNSEDVIKSHIKSMVNFR